MRQPLNPLSGQIINPTCALLLLWSLVMDIIGCLSVLSPYFLFLVLLHIALLWNIVVKAIEVQFSFGVLMPVSFFWYIVDVSALAISKCSLSLKPFLKILCQKVKQTCYFCVHCHFNFGLSMDYGLGLRWFCLCSCFSAFKTKFVRCGFLGVKTDFDWRIP